MKKVILGGFMLLTGGLVFAIIFVQQKSMDNSAFLIMLVSLVLAALGFVSGLVGLLEKDNVE